jgi:hypothetical protein
MMIGLYYDLIGKPSKVKEASNLCPQRVDVILSHGATEADIRVEIFNENGMIFASVTDKNNPFEEQVILPLVWKESKFVH